MRGIPPSRPVRAIATGLLLLAAGLAGAAGLAPQDIFGLEYASDPQLAPDGSEVAYVRRGFDIRADRGRGGIWLASADGRRHRPLAAGSHTEATPRWSPDGSRLAFIGADADGSSQLFVRYRDDDALARVTDIGDAPLDMAWSPDGRWIAFTMRVPQKATPLEVRLPEPPKGASWAEPLTVIDRMVYRADGRGYLANAWTQLFVLPAEGGTPRQLTDGPFDHEGPAFTADGSEIVVSANRREDRGHHPLDSDLYAVRVADGQLRRLTERYGPDRDPAVSADGRIAWTGFDDRLLGYQRSRLYVMEADGGGRRELAADIDRDLQAPAWSADGKRLYALSDSEGRTRLLSVSLDGAATVLADDVGGVAWSRPYTSGAYSVARDGSLAYTSGSARRPADVALRQPRGARRQLTDLNGELLGHRELGEVRELWSQSGADGRRIQSWLVLPPGFDAARKYPLILEIHGGPFASYGPHFAAELQLYAAAGYVVLYANPRGSTGYGEEFGNLIHHAYPGQDYDDLMSAVDAAIAGGFVDAGRLYVTGGSGGGVLSAWIVGKTDRFRAAAVQKPVINWTSFALTADRGDLFHRYWFAAPPWEQPEEYWRRSPLSLVGNVRTPTLVVTGELDYRTPMAESEQYYQALKLRGVDTLLVRVPGAPHALDLRPSQLIARNRYILAWFEKYR